MDLCSGDSRKTDAKETTVMFQDTATEESPRLMLTIEEAARRLSVSRSTFYDLLQRGEIESVHIGSLRRVPVDCLEEFVARCRREGRHPRTR
jgi:excisionase family DNA binding protein